MNERIEGLWWKARIGYNNQNCDPEVLEKFAELIVQDLIDSMIKRYGDDDELPIQEIKLFVKETFRS